MKYRSTTSPVTTRSLALKGSIVAAAVLMAIATPISITGESVFARDYAAEIRAVEQQISQFQSEAAKYGARADSLQDALAKITAEKAAIQAQVDLSQSKYDKLVADIKVNEDKIAKNQDSIGTVIADIYVDDDISPMEMLASSKNISEFLDKQTQRSSVRDTLKDTIDEIKSLKAQLEIQRNEVEQVLGEQKNARNALAEKEAEQAALVNETRGQQEAYSQLAQENDKKRQELQKQQQAEMNARQRGTVSGGFNNDYSAWVGGGCYVDNNLYSHGGKNGDGTDPLGYACNQCTSYAAWSVMKHTNRGYTYWGHAKAWIGSSQRANIPGGTTPRANSVGVQTAGPYGHVVWIDSVNPDGTVNGSQYNFYNAGGPGWGHYSTIRNESPRTYNYYIYF